MYLSSLPASTQRAWSVLSGSGGLSGFVLIGGTACALRLGHRVSEDLDFAYLGASLNPGQIKAALKRLEVSGFRVEKKVDMASQQDFLNSGLDLDDSQQDFIAVCDEGSVKLTFCRFSNSVTDHLEGSSSEPLRVASLHEIFKLKILACLDRSQSRDWVDLYVLMTKENYSVTDVRAMFNGSSGAISLDLLARRFQHLVPSASDPGYSQLMEGPPSMADLKDFFLGVSVNLNAGAITDLEGGSIQSEIDDPSIK